MTEPFTKMSPLQSVIVARVRLLSHVGITAPLTFEIPMLNDAGMEAVALYVACVNATRASGVTYEDMYAAIEEVLEAIHAAVKLWPMAGSYTVPLGQCDAHTVAVDRVIEICRRHGFTNREGWRLAHTVPAGLG